MDNPHVPHSLECATHYLIRYGRQQISHHLWEYRAKAQQALSTAGQVVFCYHAEHLVTEAPGLMQQQLQMEMGYSQGGHIVVGPWLLSCMLVELLC